MNYQLSKVSKLFIAIIIWSNVAICGEEIIPIHTSTHTTNIGTNLTTGITFSPTLRCDCDFTASSSQDCDLTERDVKITLDAGDLYQHGGLIWNYSIPIKVEIYTTSASSCTSGLFYASPTLNFNIGDGSGSHIPRQVELLNLTQIMLSYSSSQSCIDYIKITQTAAGSLTGANSALVQPSIRLKVELVDHVSYKTKDCHTIPNDLIASDLSVQSINASTLDPTKSNRVRFSWEEDPSSLNIHFDHWELELLKLEPFYISSFNYEVDWKKAARYSIDGQTHFETTLSHGTGVYLWRVRAIGEWDDHHTYGEWTSTPALTTNPYIWTTTSGFVNISINSAYSGALELCPSCSTVIGYCFYYEQFDEDINWIHTKVLTEGSRQSETMTFANGLNQAMQTQTHLQSKGSSLATQSVYDYSGRNALTSLPATTDNSYVNYEPSFFEYYNGGTERLFNAKDFDDPSTTLYSPNNLNVNVTTPSSYYSDNNNGTMESQLLPQGENRTFSRVLYQPDATGRPWKQAMPGIPYDLSATSNDPENDHNTVIQYAKPAQDELDWFFGNEAPLAQNVQKVQTIDPNGVRTLSYVTNKGQTIATALNGEGPIPENMMEVPGAETLSVVDILPPGEPNKTGWYSEVFTSLLVDVAAGSTKPIKFDYKILPKDFHLDCDEACGCDFCWECDYRIEIEIRCPQAPLDVDRNVLWTFNIYPPALQCEETLTELDLADLIAGSYNMQLLDPSGAASTSSNFSGLTSSTPATANLPSGVYNIYKRVYTHTEEPTGDGNYLDLAKEDVYEDAETWTKDENCCGPFVPDTEGWDCGGEDISCSDPSFFTTLLPNFRDQMMGYLTEEQSALVNNGNNYYKSYLTGSGASLWSTINGSSALQTALQHWICDLGIPSSSIADCFEAMYLVMTMNVSNVNAVATNNAGNTGGSMSNQNALQYDNSFDLFYAVEQCIGANQSTDPCSQMKNIVFFSGPGCVPSAEEAAAMLAATGDPTYRYYVIWHQGTGDPQVICPMMHQALGAQVTYVEIPDITLPGPFSTTLMEQYLCYEDFKYPNALVDGMNEADGRAYLASKMCNCLSITSANSTLGGSIAAGNASDESVATCEDMCMSKQLAFDIAIDNYELEFNATTYNAFNSQHPEWVTMFDGDERACFAEAMTARCLRQCQLPLSTAAESFNSVHALCSICGTNAQCLPANLYLPTSPNVYDCYQDFMASGEFRDSIVREHLAFEQAFLWGQKFAPFLPSGGYSDFGEIEILNEEIIQYFYSALDYNMMMRDPSSSFTLATIPVTDYPVNVSGSAWALTDYYTQKTKNFNYSTGSGFKTITAVINVIWNDNPTPVPPNFTQAQDDIIEEINIALYCEDNVGANNNTATAIMNWAYYPSNYQAAPACQLFQGNNPMGYKLELQLVHFYFDVAGKFHAVLKPDACSPGNVTYTSNTVCVSDIIATASIQISASGTGSVNLEAGPAGSTQYIHGASIPYTTNAATTAALIADAINDYHTSPDYTALAVGNLVNIYLTNTVGEDPASSSSPYELIPSSALWVTVLNSSAPFVSCASQTLAFAVTNACGPDQEDQESRTCPYGYFKVEPNDYPKYHFNNPAQVNSFLVDYKNFVNESVTQILINRPVSSNPMYSFGSAPFDCIDDLPDPILETYERTKDYIINNNHYKAIITFLGQRETNGSTTTKVIKALHFEMRCMNTSNGAPLTKLFEFEIKCARSGCNIVETLLPGFTMDYNSSTGVFGGFQPVGNTFQAIPDLFTNIYFMDWTGAPCSYDTTNTFDQIRFDFVTSGVYSLQNAACIPATSSCSCVGADIINQAASFSFFNGSATTVVPPVCDADLGYMEAVFNGHSGPCEPYDCAACMRWVKPEEIEVDLNYQPLTCEEQRAMYEQSQVDNYIDDCLESKMDEITDSYIDNCLMSIEDEFSVAYDLVMGGITLYYQDRAGNLIKTIPPKGVKTLTPTERSKVRDYRLNPVTYSSAFTVNAHLMATEYKYNSLKQLVESTTPDGNYDAGTSTLKPTHHWYNPVGHLVLSQDARQQVAALGEYSFSLYDGYNRLIRSGVLVKDPIATEEVLVAEAWNNYWFPYTGSDLLTLVPNVVSSVSEVHVTTYNSPYTLSLVPGSRTGRNLLNRVSRVIRDEDGNLSTTMDQVVGYYSYDPHGNVEWFVQWMPEIGYTSVDMDYNLVSGTVNKVTYQQGTKEQFMHRYTYDEDNRITKVETSEKGLIWDTDATYEYYLHGPLKRTNLGNDRLQGIDYVYTLQGWLKSINQVELDDYGDTDPGRDGAKVIKFDMALCTANVAITESSTSLITNSPVAFNSDHLVMANEFVTKFNNNYPNEVYRADNEDGKSTEITLYMDNSTVLPVLTGCTTTIAFELTNYVKDEFAMELGYNDNDYYRTANKIGADANGASGAQYNPYASTTVGPSGSTPAVDLDVNSLWNGNISYWLANNREGANTTLTGFDIRNIRMNLYRYDRWNRIRKSHYYPYSGTDYAALTATAPLLEEFSYDANGNLATLSRWANGSTIMDNFTYNNPLDRNRLPYVSDAAASIDYSIDIDDQVANNYTYDANGNLVGDVSENLTVIWNNLGKVKEVWKTGGSGSTVKIKYMYDAMGNRIKKEVGTLVGETYTFDEITYYALDAQGNVMAVYKKTYGTGTNVFLAEHHLYGSDRLGIRQKQIDRITGASGRVTYTTATTSGNIGTTSYGMSESRALSYKIYELKDHLGNVRTSLSDRRVAVPNLGATAIDFYTVDVASFTDYYAFGSPQPGRNYQSDNYRYGFNGMEKDDEVKGSGNSYTTHFRQYDPRLGRWFSLDPEMAKFPDQSPYAFVFNNPINLTDIYGDCPDQTDCETIGSKAEKTANSLMQQNGGSADFSNFEFSDEQRSMLFNEDGGLNALGKQVNTIVKDQGYLQKHNAGAAGMLSEMVNSGELSNTALTELSGLRSQLVSETKALYMKGIFSPENVGMALAMYSPAKLPSTRGSSMMQSELPLLRKAYMKSVGNLQGMGQTMLKQGYSKEVVAKVLHAQRRYLGTVYKDATSPQMLKMIYSRNMVNYGDKLGPSIKYLREQGASWDDIINSASRTGGKDLGF